MNKVKKTYRLSTSTVEKIERMSESHSETFSSIVENSVRLYHEDVYNENQEIVNLLSSVERELKRIRVIGNVVDRDIKMILEFWNHYFYAKKFTSFVTTEDLKADQLTMAEEVVKGRITKNRQRKLDWEDKRKNSN